MGFKWEVEPGLAIDELRNRYSKTVFLSGNRVAKQRAKDMEEWAKEHAPWTDRTGEARRTLAATVAESPGVIGEITIAHGVPYGVWLEIANGGRYAIITHTIDYWGPIFMRDIQGIVNLGLAAK